MLDFEQRNHISALRFSDQCTVYHKNTAYKKEKNLNYSNERNFEFHWEIGT